MNRPFISSVFLLITISGQLSEGLRCFQHDRCTSDCPSVSSMKIITCPANQNRCWTHTTSDGTESGCVADDCEVLVDVGVTKPASLCCSNDLCNSAISTHMNRILIIIVLFALFLLYGQRN